MRFIDELEQQVMENHRKAKQEIVKEIDRVRGNRNYGILTQTSDYVDFTPEEMTTLDPNRLVIIAKCIDTMDYVISTLYTYHIGNNVTIYINVNY